MTDERWEVLSSSGTTPLGHERWAVGKLLELASHPSVDLRLHTVRRRTDGALSIAVMIRAADLDNDPVEIRDALKASDTEIIPLALIAEPPAKFQERWDDIGRLPSD